MQSAVPTLERIRIYPVKSLDGVDVEHAPVLASGALAWDLRYALHDEQGAVINGKRCPQVHAVRIVWTPDADTLGFVARAGSERLSGRLPASRGLAG